MERSFPKIVIQIGVRFKHEVMFEAQLKSSLRHQGEIEMNDELSVIIRRLAAGIGKFDAVLRLVHRQA
ncbi:hypothetical protein BIY29_03165 [Brenneria alni]|uniref:Uncharacterized protein n=1 Tax=Brenneria alni TaxID=71656 RepID=A0A421DSD8_9GAMM|nr:hypothetical protein [Brenneria alni]RLM27236.1 hypothetical protein BIY29_03165 [Brenneria alni]